jgi:hypothetical protein
VGFKYTGQYLAQCGAGFGGKPATSERARGAFDRSRGDDKSLFSKKGAVETSIKILLFRIQALEKQNSKYSW